MLHKNQNISREVYNDQLKTLDFYDTLHPYEHLSWNKAQQIRKPLKL